MINKQDGTAWARSLDTSVPFIKIVGGGGTGKTLGLAQRVAFLLEKGVAPADIVVFCSTLSAADQFESLLGTLAGATDVEVCTVAQYAVDMLGQPRVKAVTGRNPRILAEFEQSILMEDMKVCGLKPKRLREMLKFFYKEICELRDKDDDFIRDSEEQDVYETLMENLRLRDAMLPQELSNVALRFMREHPVEAAAFKRDFVLVDDHMNLNLASQGLVEAIANRNLTIAGSLNSQVATMEPSPNPKGFNTFELAHEGVEVVTLSKGLRCPDRITAMANALVTSGGLRTSELVESGCGSRSEVRFVKWTHPNDEFMGVARYIKHRLEDAQHPIHAHDIFVAVPNPVWGRALAKVLDANRIRTDLIISRESLRGDLRKMDKSRDLQAYVRLNLLANPQGAVAWRSWCAFGDYLCNSNHWFHLEKYAQSANVSVLEALERASLLSEDELFPGAAVLVARYLEGKRFIEHGMGKTGFALLNHCSPVRGDEPPAAFMRLVEPVAGHETAMEFFQRASQRMEARFTTQDAVRIGLMQMSNGMSFDTVIIMGAIEGFWPTLITLGAEYDDDRIADIQRQERREWYAAMTKSRYAFVVSTVQKDESNTSTALGMHVKRIRMEDNRSMAILAPTRYLEEMGQEAPGFEASI